MQEDQNPVPVPTGYEVPTGEIPPAPSDVEWTASEFIAHAKSANWYLGLTVVTVIVAVVVYLITRDTISTGVIIACGLLLGVYANHQPKQIHYQMSQTSLTIGSKQFSYNEFKTFTVQPEGAFASIVLIPHKRFMPQTTIYYAPDDEDKIIGLLSEHVPYEQRKPDGIDRLMQRIRF